MSADKDDKLQVRPYSLKKLAGLYYVSKNTFKKWLEPIRLEIGQREGYYYTIHQVKIIFRHLGIPDEKGKKKIAGSK